MATIDFSDSQLVEMKGVFNFPENFDLVQIEERIKWAGDGIHLTDESYYQSAAQVANIKADPKLMKDFVN